MEFIKAHVVDIVILIVIGIILFFAIKRIVLKKGKCAYCDHADTCPFKTEDKKRSA